MATQGAPQEERPPSFKQATDLQKTNQILQQVLQYFSKFPQHLQEEGLLRLSGKESIVAPILQEMTADPTKKMLFDRKEFEHDPHSAVSVLKKLHKQPLKLSDSTVLQLKHLYQEDPNVTVDEIVTSIINAEHSSIEAKLNAIEEAKLIHNIFHLCYLVAKNTDKNKMTSSNVAIVVGPWFDNLTMHISKDTMENALQILKLQQVLQPTLRRLIDTTINDAKAGKNPKLADSFDKAYPSQAQLLENDYREKFKPQKPTGNLLTRVVGAFLRGLKNLFSRKSKQKSQESNPSVSKQNLKAQDVTAGLDHEASLSVERVEPLAAGTRKAEVNEPRRVVSPQFEQAQSEAERRRLRSSSQEIIKELKERQAERKDETPSKPKQSS